MSKLSALIRKTRKAEPERITEIEYNPEQNYEVIFEYDYNLRIIEKWVHAYFKHQNDHKERALETNGRLTALHHELSTKRSINDRRNIIKSMQEELTKINASKTNQIQEEFHRQSQLLLHEYDILGPYMPNLEHERKYQNLIEGLKGNLSRAVPGSLSFDEMRMELCRCEVMLYTPLPIVRTRVSLIMSYCELARKYIKLTVSRHPNIKIHPECSECHHVILTNFVNDESFQICVICGNQEYKAGGRFDAIRSDIPIIEKSDDVNIMKAFRRYGCLENVKLPEDMFAKLDEHFAELKIFREEILEMPLKGRYRGNTNHKKLWIALDKKGFNKYYKHADLIGMLYWGWQQPQIVHLETKFLDMYHKTQVVFNRLEKARKSSISTQLRLYHQLELLGHPCEITEFKIPKGAIGIMEQEELWRHMCEGANDPNIYYKPLQ